MTDDKQRELEDAIELVLTAEISDSEAERVLASEGIYTWGPDAERFERMFAFLMKMRRAVVDARQP